jgi:hypothetical protein
MDETICPADFERAGMITDDQVFNLIVAPLPSGCRLTAVMDCCHSGTGLDLPWICQVPHPRPPPTPCPRAGAPTLPRRRRKRNRNLNSTAGRCASAHLESVGTASLLTARPPPSLKAAGGTRRTTRTTRWVTCNSSAAARTRRPPRTPAAGATTNRVRGQNTNAITKVIRGFRQTLR